MNHGRSRKLFFDQTADSYGNRIRHLEEIVCLLLAQTNTAQLPCVPAAPLTSMFRYSTDQGLVPVLSKKMVISLADDQKNMRLKGGTPHLNPSCPNNVLRYFHSSTQSTTSTPSFSPPTRSPSARSPLSAAPPSSSTPSSNHSKHPKDPTIPHGGASTPLSNSPTSRARQFKTTKGHKTMSTGYGSLRTISGVYQGPGELRNN
ncbi:uncharacterized protein PGTG_19552 [Puccinia graminis f. sp. tritici CRL 75-36-700-3]|uniref:Uncharacterized protein n=1 Tax=Puccinia graminis f. sp. tritici (strain CRL 75-36-700-3 / race SCCL) TaxID=418459 RepID=E3LAT2_PUCGT|nr:uncharacterized protein PGTG_19552 [Puccinia graminis f. sp. tritici CRL 75-36-700-3]EFP93657.2 hypothetical protein PGTG_19552 [Puccinia graminis f. sp. tritici CRL 75-36-700-3]